MLNNFIAYVIAHSIPVPIADWLRSVLRNFLRYRIRQLVSAGKLGIYFYAIFVHFHVIKALDNNLVLKTYILLKVIIIVYDIHDFDFYFLWSRGLSHQQVGRL